MIRLPFLHGKLMVPPVGEWDQERQDLLSSCRAVGQVLGSPRPEKEAMSALEMEIAHGVFFVTCFHYLLALSHFWKSDELASHGSRRLTDGRRIVVLKRMFGQAKLVIGAMSFDDPTYSDGWIYRCPAEAMAAMDRWSPESELEPSGWLSRDRQSWHDL